MRDGRSTGHLTKAKTMGCFNEMMQYYCLKASEEHLHRSIGVKCKKKKNTYECFSQIVTKNDITAVFHMLLISIYIYIKIHSSYNTLLTVALNVDLFGF